MIRFLFRVIIIWKLYKTRSSVKVNDWSTANKLSSNISIKICMLFTKKHVNTDSIKININDHRMEGTSRYKHLGVIVDVKLTWKEKCKWLCCAVSKYVGVIYKVKHFASNRVLRKSACCIQNYCLGKTSFMSSTGTANTGYFK